MEELTSRITVKKYPFFKGGYEFKHFTESAFPKEIITVPAPKKVVLRLRQGFGNEVPLTVKKGDKVKAGQILTCDDEAISTPILASVSGTVGDTLQVTHGKKTVNAIEIKTMADQEFISVERPNKDPLSFSSEEIGKILYMSGVSALGKHGIPTQYHSSVIGMSAVKEVIVNMLHTRPYAFPHDFIFENYCDQFISSLKILKRLYPQARLNVTLPIDKQKKFFEIFKHCSFNEEITFHLLSNKYPQEQQDVLLKNLFNKELPIGKSAINMGVVMFAADEMLPIYEAVFEGKPLLERLIFVAGSGCQAEGMYRVKIGTPASAFLKLKEDVPVRLLSGGVLTGRLLDNHDGPTNKSTYALTVLIAGATRDFLSFLAPGLKKDSYTNTFLSSFVPGFTKQITTNINGDKRACITCNYCDEVCPVQIIPHLLYKLISKDLLEEAVRFKLTSCINCGLCTYVCPSKIDLADTIFKNLLKVHGE